MADEDKREYISYYHDPCKTTYAIDVTFIEVPHSVANQYQTSFECPRCKVKLTLFYQESDVKDKPEGEEVHS